jgi:alpha-L-rhamnosidase
MKKLFLLSAAIFLNVALANAAVQLDRLRCEYLNNPLGIDALKPELSWVLRSDDRGQRQTAYQVLVASTPESLQQDKGDLWDSGKVASDQSTFVVYAGKPLTSHLRCHWKVRVWDKDGQPSAWSQPAFWTMGILQPNEWHGKWLSYTKEVPCEGTWVQKAPSPVFRKTFEVKQPIRSATVNVCGLGFYEMHLNGNKVGDHVLDPSFTRYDKRALYVTYDVTKQLKQGLNAIGAMLGNGWYNSHTRCVWDFDKAPWRDKPRLLVELRIELADGSVKTVVTDDTWRATIGPVVRDAIRNGEVYDARRELPGWDTPNYDDANWGSVEVVSSPKGALRAQMMPSAKVTQIVKPVSVKEPKPGVFVVDMGQNLAGWTQMKVSGPAGASVSLKQGERLAQDGTVDSAGLAQHVKAGPFQTDTYILKGQGEETFEPHFTYHGFQYVEVTGFPGKPTVDNFRAMVVHTDFDKAGIFACSNELLNTIQKHTIWSYRSNFVDGYPTDCPHREKNGWTGDAQLAAEQAMYNFDNNAAYRKWMNDLKDEQQANGNLPGIVPTSGWGYAWGNGPPWDSATVLIPWYLYLYQGDVRVLAEHYDGMKRYVDFMTSRAKDHLISFGLGDWVPAKTTTPELVTSSGYYYADAVIVAKTAALLGKTEDAKKYGDLAESIRQAFNKQLYKGDGIYANGSQTSLSCAVYQGFAEPSQKARVIAQLVANVERANNHLDVGILGAKYLFHVLSDNGRNDVAYRIATRTTAPSYGDWIRRGSTTLWEDWGDGASRNHIMFGDISAWFHQNLGGLNVDPKMPGFKHSIIRPQPVGDLTWAKSQHETQFGTLSCHWQIKPEGLSMNVVIPANTTATVYVPAAKAEAVTEGGKPAAQTTGVKFVRFEDGYAVFDVGSGKYDFFAAK